MNSVVYKKASLLLGNCKEVTKMLVSTIKTTKLNLEN